MGPSPSSSDFTSAPALPVQGSTARAAVILYAVPVFLGAFLLFLIEPMIAKVILPWFGGSAAVWSVCLVFFQSALLLGYLYADLTTRWLSPRRQAILHITLLLVCALFLPVAPGQYWRPIPGHDPSGRILGLLATSIGFPFLLLSATSPLLQTWYARRRLAAEPYHLFALSNLSSFLALLSYPFLIEPRFTAHIQLRAWSALFVAFAVICSLAAWSSRSSAALASAAPVSGDAAPRRGARLLWFALSACGSMLLLSITNHLTQNVAPVPLLWVFPLAIYLLTFAMTFNRRSLYSRWLVICLLAVVLGSMGYLVSEPIFIVNLPVKVPLFCAGLFVCCLFCHGELYRLKPAASRLTSYYLIISLGGALGAVLVGLVAPRVFRNVYEFPVTLLLMALLAGAVLWRGGILARLFWAGAAVAMTVVLVMNIRSRQEDAIVMVRSFYGALRVTEDVDNSYIVRTLYNGTIVHGIQMLSPELHMRPTTYYGPESGIGIALENCCNGPKRVGVIGLGAGTLAAYGRPGDFFRFYDINSQVVEIAQTSFTFLSDTPARTEIVLGDARLSLEREPPQQFDVLAVDAFSGDAIPVHLLTREAVLLYLRHLKPDGILAIHTSNSYLQLTPVAKQLADSVGYSAVFINNEEDPPNVVYASDWVLITRNQAFLKLDDVSSESTPIDVPKGLPLWTDGYNSLFRILRPVRWRESDSD
jgi:hypothetical protein